MLKLKLLAAVAAVLGLCDCASAQPRRPAGYSPPPATYRPGQPTANGQGYRPVTGIIPSATYQQGFQQPLIYPPGFGQPSVPVFVTPNSPTGINPFTGGIDTANTQINNSAFDPGRTQAMNNGTMRPVDQPIYDSFGNVTGQRTGVEWYNPNTGRWNGQVNNQTNNNLGGVNDQMQAYSANPMATRQSGNATPNRAASSTTRMLPNGQRSTQVIPLRR